MTVLQHWNSVSQNHFNILIPGFCYDQLTSALYLTFLICPWPSYIAGFSTRWIDHWGTWGVRSDWRWRYGRLGKGIFLCSYHPFLWCSRNLFWFLVYSVQIVCTSMFSPCLLPRLEIKLDKWVMFQKSTYSFPPQTAYWACCSLWLLWTVGHTRPAIPQKQNSFQAASMEMLVVKTKIDAQSGRSPDLD